MGRKNGGVEVRDSSIRLSFTTSGVRYRSTLMTEGEPLAPTPANIKYANRLIMEICDRIRADAFRIEDYFPHGATPVKKIAAQPAESEAALLLATTPEPTSARTPTPSGKAAPKASTPKPSAVKPSADRPSSPDSRRAKHTVQTWLTAWLKMQRIEKSTRDGYENVINFWSRSPCDEFGHAMGALLLTALKLSHILVALAHRSDLSGKTVNNYVSVLRQALTLAVADQLLSINVAEAVPRAKHQRLSADPFSRDEMEAIITAAADIHAQIHNYIELWFWSGLRTSEINGLEWRYVDFKDNTIAIERVLVAGEEKNRTKTAEARLVRLNSRSRAALLRQRAFTQVRGGRVFQDPRTGKPWHSEEAFQRVFWARILKRLGIRYRRPYNMRHSYATSMLMAGMTPAFCARQLGHTVEMFLRTYAKWIDGSQNDLEMARLENALGGELTSLRHQDIAQ